MFRYLPPHALGGRAHVIIDGAPRRGTAYTLSHWPGTPTPPGLNADLSARSYVMRSNTRSYSPVCQSVSIDHYDVDGVGWRWRSRWSPDSMPSMGHFWWRPPESVTSMW